MFRFRTTFPLLMLCFSLSGGEAQKPLSSVEALTHLYHYKILKKEVIDINGIVDYDLTKTAFNVESDNIPRPPWHIIVRFRNGEKDLLLIPRSDNDIVKGTVFLEGKNGEWEDLNYVSPCDWSLDGRNLLVSGHEYDQQSQSVWSIDMKTMRGKPISRLLKDEYAYGAKFSPSGKEVAYAMGPIKRSDGLRSTAFQDYWILLYNLVSGKTKRVAKGLHVEWSPNSKRLLVTTATQIWVMDKDGTHKTLIYPTPGNKKYSFERYTGLHFDHRGWEDYRSLGWLDESHLVVEVRGKNNSARVVILDDRGRILQTIPSVGLSRVWAAKKRMILTEKLADGKYKIWSVNY